MNMNQDAKFETKETKEISENIIKVSEKSDEVDKIDIEDLIKELKVHDTKALILYLNNIWKDFNKRNNEGNGISKNLFAKFYELPGVILERLFNSLDSERSGFLTEDSFTKGLVTLFTGTFDQLCELIFNMYDYDRDSLVSTDDITVVLSYIPLKTINSIQTNKLRYEKLKSTFTEQIESQKEICQIIESSFPQGKTHVTISDFKKIILDKNSEMFVFLLIYLLESRPFSLNTLKKMGVKDLENTYNANPVFVVTPRINSRFSPAVTIGKSPAIKKKAENSFEGKKAKKTLDIYAKKKENIIEKIIEEKDDKDEKEKQNAMKRKSRTSQIKKSLESTINEDKMATLSKNNYDNLPISGGVLAVEVEKGRFPSTKLDFVIEEKNEKHEDDDEEEETKLEGYIYCKQESEASDYEKKWFTLNNKDLSCFDDNSSANLVWIINLSGVFCEEIDPRVISDKELQGLCLKMITKVQNYYFESVDQRDTWLKAIRRVTGYTNIQDIYEVLGTVNKGKFGVVKLGMHRKTGRRVAIKVLKKEAMSIKDLEQIRTEIEILKICQHPNIIQLYDVFENFEYLYIIMEYCSGGDLFSYLDLREFEIKEARAAELLQQLCVAVFYLHNYGIIHRDLKPENILMSDETDEAIPKILDFGLSRLLNPGEFCNESHGTVGYCCPEVLLEEDYTFSADIWSLGVIAYLLIIGTLPFDHDSDQREIARMTIEDPPNFSDRRWRHYTPEARDFVKRILVKNPDERMKIEEILDHKWFLIQDSKESTKLRAAENKKGKTKFEIYSSYDKV